MDIPARVQTILADAVARGASDVHVEPTAQGGEVRLRVDGLLTASLHLTAEQTAAVVARLMVMANLLTYRRDVPQEGRAAVTVPTQPAAAGGASTERAGERIGGRAVELRVSVMPTTHGLRAAVRLPAELNQPKSVAALDLDAPAAALIDAFVDADGGVLAVVGPAGSGKTTTAYATLSEIVRRRPGLSVVSLEDPVERDLPGVTQIQVQPFGQLTYATALRSMLRQDPQVLMLGEIRDAETASIAVQAGLSGHRLVCTLHAADAALAVSRLLEMGLEPYQIGQSLFGVIAQRLVRRTTPDGYAGRLPVCEAVRVDGPLRRLISGRAEADDLRSAYVATPGFVTLREAARRRVDAGQTDAEEVRRVLGSVPARSGRAGESGD